MKITDQRDGTLAVLSLEGRLDHAGAGVFQEYSVGLIGEGVRTMIVDFGGTSFIASMGIRALIIPTQEISKVGGKLVLTGLNADLARLFELSGMKDMFQTYPTVDDAKASLR